MADNSLTIVSDNHHIVWPYEIFQSILTLEIAHGTDVVVFLQVFEAKIYLRLIIERSEMYLRCYVVNEPYQSR